MTSRKGKTDNSPSDSDQKGVIRRKICSPVVKKKDQDDREDKCENIILIHTNNRFDLRLKLVERVASSLNDMVSLQKAKYDNKLIDMNHLGLNTVIQVANEIRGDPIDFPEEIDQLIELGYTARAYGMMNLFRDVRHRLCLASYIIEKAEEILIYPSILLIFTSIAQNAVRTFVQYIKSPPCSDKLYRENGSGNMFRICCSHSSPADEESKHIVASTTESPARYLCAAYPTLSKGDLYNDMICRDFCCEHRDKVDASKVIQRLPSDIQKIILYDISC